MLKEANTKCHFIGCINRAFKMVRQYKMHRSSNLKCKSYQLSTLISISSSVFLLLIVKYSYKNKRRIFKIPFDMLLIKKFTFSIFFIIFSLILRLKAFINILS